MSTQDIVETWKQQWIEEGIRQGVEKGIETGIKRGLETGIKRGLEKGIAQTLVEVYEARFGAMPAKLRKVLETTHDEATLRGWSKLIVTQPAEEIAKALLRKR